MPGAEPLFLGVDGGGTKTDILVGPARGEPVRRLRLGSGNVSALGEDGISAVAELVKTAADQPDRVDRRERSPVHRVLPQTRRRLTDHGGMRDRIERRKRRRIAENARCQSFSIQPVFVDGPWKTRRDRR